MSNTSLIFAVFSVLVGVLLFSIWSNIHVYAQQLSSHTASASPPSAAGISSGTTTISPELKAKMCDPSNPSLKVVNTTESHICGIPKTVKPPLSLATPPTAATLSSPSTPPPQQTTKSPPSAASVAAPKQQQQQQITIANNNNNNAITPAASQLPLYEEGYTKGVADAKLVQSRFPSSTTMTPDDVDCDSDIDPHMSNEGYCSGYQHGFADTNNNVPPVLRPLSGGGCPSGYHLVSEVTCIKDVKPTSTTTVPARAPSITKTTTSTIAPVSNPSNKSLSSPSTITPQMNAINNNKLMYLGYHGGSTDTSSAGKTGTSTKSDSNHSTNRDSSTKDKSISDTKPFIHHIISSDSSSSSTKDKSISDTKLSHSHGSDSITTGDSSSSSSSTKDKHTSDTKPSTHSTTRGTSDSSSTGKKDSSGTKSDITPSNADRSLKKGKSSSSVSSTDHGSKSSSISDLGSAIRNRVDSILRNNLGGVKHSLFSFSDDGRF
jgi:trimeric autotransporter adhesin